jgi:hypothetical protein
MVFSYGDDANSDYGTVRAVTVVGTTAYMGDEYVFASVTTYTTQLIYDPTRDRMALACTDTTNYNELSVRSFTVGAAHSTTNPYDFSSSDFNDTGGSDTKHVQNAHNSSQYTQTCGANFFDYNPTYDTYFILYERDTDDANCIAALHMDSDGSWDSGTEVVFENSAQDIYTSVYDSNIQRTVLIYNEGSSNSSPSGGKMNVVKQSGTNNLTLTLAGELDFGGRLPNTPSDSGRKAAYVPEFGSNGMIMALEGVTYGYELKYNTISGSDGAGYTRSGGSIGNYAYLGGHNTQSAYGGVYYVKGRGRCIVFKFNVETSFTDGTDIKSLVGHILEWDGDSSNDDIQDAVLGHHPTSDTYPVYDARVQFVETATTGSSMRPYDTFGDCALNDRTAFGPMLGACTNYSNSKTQFTRLIEVGDNGTTGAPS